MAKKHTEKFDAEDVPLLILLAKGLDTSEEPDRHTIIATKEKRGWLKTLTQIEARDELELRFRRIVATLVNVCITGRPNYWSSYQKTFLKLFAGTNVPVQNVASMLKRELAGYEKEELFSTGQLAVFIAVEKCKTNFASTIVMCFKDLIHKMIEDPSNKMSEEIDQNLPAKTNIENEIAFSMFLESLNEEESICAQRLIEGEKVKEVPASLTLKLQTYLGWDYNNNR